MWIDGVALGTLLGTKPLDTSALMVLREETDWLAVRVAWGSVDVVVVSYHAPHSQHDESDVRRWWQQAKS